MGGNAAIDEDKQIIVSAVS